jgi:hypothetical protein
MAKVKHIALFKFKDSATPEQIDNIFNDFLDITETIPGIEDYVSGPNCSPEAKNQGYTHGFVMTFTDMAALNAYLPHAEHERVKAGMAPHVDSVLVFDFEL